MYQLPEIEYRLRATQILSLPIYFEVLGSANNLGVERGDGVTEAENPAGEELGDDRLAAWWGGATGQSATETVDTLYP